MGWVIQRVFKKTPPPSTKKIKIERKYALCLLMAVVVFTFGSLLPFLFFVAAISFFVQYILDKLLLTYWYELLAQ